MRDFSAGGRSAVYADNAMVATSHPLSSAAAMDVLRNGGNAVDAAIAAVAVQGVVEPQMTGIGGDCFAIIAEPDGSLHCMDGSGRSPAGSDIQRLIDEGHTQVEPHGHHAVTVPGAVRAWEAMHQKFGQHDWSDVLQPAVEYARNGWIVAPRVAADWADAEADLIANGATALLNGGRAYRTGERVTNEALAKTLDTIATKGASAFYEGEIAEDIVTTLQARGSAMTQDDLAANEADWVTPIRTTYADHEIVELPPSGQGMTALTLLNLYEELGNREYEPGSVERWHRDLEAGRLAYSVRDAYLADPAHMSEPVEHLISEAYAKELAQGFDPARRNPSISLPQSKGSDTVYLTVVDKDRRCVSLINSIFGDFGSQIVTEKTGIVLQNRGAGFSLDPNHANALGPNKKPLHTIIPAMVLKDEKPAISFGVMGGQYQPMGHAHVLSLMLDHGLDPQQAIDHPRAFWDEEGQTVLEKSISQGVFDGLAAKGHRPVWRPHAMGGSQIIRLSPEGHLVGGSDGRKDGMAIGY
ncbi:MAG: gamma-glutamyltransferase [Pseudomonadota bacterium]